jgi:hypothetical protein
MKSLEMAEKMELTLKAIRKLQMSLEINFLPRQGQNPLKEGQFQLIM